MTAMVAPAIRPSGRGLAIAGSMLGIVIVAGLVMIGVANGLDQPHDVPNLVAHAFLFGGPFLIGGLVATLERTPISAGGWIGAGAAATGTLTVAFGLTSPLLIVPAALVLAGGIVAAGRDGLSPTALVTPIVASIASLWSLLVLSESACWLLRNGVWVKAPYSTTIVGTGVCGRALSTPAQAMVTTAAWIAGGVVLVLLARRQRSFPERKA